MRLLLSHNFSVRLSVGVRDELVKAAAEDSRSVNSLINKILADWVSRRRPPKQIERKRGLR